MDETSLLSIEPVDTSPKSSLRVRADQAKQLRCRTLICVLENPSNLNNLATIMRNIDALGVSRLYVISNDNQIVRPSNRAIRRIINPLSSSAYKWIFIKYFDSTEKCLQHLEKNHYSSVVTSPHVKGKINYNLLEANFTKYKNLAVWFGNESSGISQEAIENSVGCIHITMAGIIESLNLSITTGIVLHFIAEQRSKDIEE